MDNNKKKLFSNTFMLYILSFSTYFFSFITVPYQTRILGPEYFGKIGFALAFCTYFQLFFDFGFILSSTEDVAKNRNKKKELGRILTSVNAIKLLFIIMSFILLIILCTFVSKFNQDPLLYILYFIYISLNAFLPDFLYRGLEDMKIITYRSVLVRFIFTILIFVFLKDKTQYYLVPILNIVGTIIALLVVYLHVFVKLKIKLEKVKLKYLFETLKKSSMFFLSRIATTLYGATNTFILGFLYPTGISLGLYIASEKLVTTAKSVFTPISDSMYPYMIKNKDFKLLKKLLLIFMPIITIGCLLVFIFAKEFCVIILGREYIGSANILRLMLPIVVITLPNYLLGFPTMSPLGISKYANLSVIYGSIIHVANLITFWILGWLNIYTICILTIITELIVLSIRIFYIYRKRRELNI